MTLNNKKGFTLLELLITIAIISIVAVVAIPQLTTFKTRAYDADAQSNLRSVFTACKDFWSFNSSISPCLLTNVANTEFGFVPSDAVEITIESNANNTEYDFYATASHTSSSAIFVIDYRGAVRIASVGGGNYAGNNGNKGNNGNAGGCSEQAQNGPPWTKRRGRLQLNFIGKVWSNIRRYKPKFGISYIG